MAQPSSDERGHPEDEPSGEGKGGDRTPGSRRIACLAVVALAGYTVLSRLDGALSRMQLPGEVAGTATGLATPSSLFGAEGAARVATAWKAWDEARPKGASGSSAAETVGVYAAVDALLLTAPLVAIVFLLAKRGKGTASQTVHSLQTAQASSTSDAASTQARERRAKEIGSLARFVPFAAVLYGLFDIAEGLALMSLAAGPGTGRALLVGAMSAAKWLALLTAVVLLLMVWLNAIATRRSLDRRDTAPGWVDEVVALRAQVLALVLLALFVALPGDLGHQVDDAVLALDKQRSGAIATTIVVTVALCVLIYSSGRWCLKAYEEARDPGPGSVSKRALALVLLGGAALIAAGALSLSTSLPLVALLVPGALLFAGGLLTLPVRDARPRPWSPAPVQDRLLWWLAAAPLLLVGLVDLRAGTLVWIAGEPGAESFIVMGALTLALGVTLPLWRPMPREIPLRAHIVSALVVAVAAFVAGVAGGIWPVEVGRAIGAWAVISLFCTLMLAVLAGLVLLGDHLPARGILAVLGFRRVPLVALLALCVVVTSAVDSRWAYHDVRLAATDGSDVREHVVTLEMALDQWHADLPAGEQPLVLVAAAGGGIRAAYWTAGALSCIWHGTAATSGDDAPTGTITLSEEDLEDGDGCGDALSEQQRHAFFLASGISGGSVGLAVTRALDDQPQEYSQVLGADFLGSNMAGYVFRDVPNSVLRRLPFEDRAAVMEHAWQSAVSDVGGDLSCGLLASSFEPEDGGAACGQLREGAPLRFPVLALNSMAIDDGCRLTASPLELGLPGLDDKNVGRNCRSLDGITAHPLTEGTVLQDRRQLGATRDVLDLTCGGDRTEPADLPLSAAAHISARFPYVSPSGRLVSCAEDRDPSHTLDGGLLESSAAGPISDLLPTVLSKIAQWNRPNEKGAEPATCVVPRLLLLDNGYVNLAAQGERSRPLEAVAPLGGLGAAFGGRSATARQLAALQVQRAADTIACGDDSAAPGDDGAPPPAVAHVLPLAHPGVQAPLGWTLSTYSQRDLTRELTSKRNLCQYAVVRSWFGDSNWRVACERTE